MVLGVLCPSIVSREDHVLHIAAIISMTMVLAITTASMGRLLHSLKLICFALTRVVVTFACIML